MNLLTIGPPNLGRLTCLVDTLAFGNLFFSGNWQLAVACSLVYSYTWLAGRQQLGESDVLQDPRQ